VQLCLSKDNKPRSFGFCLCNTTAKASLLFEYLHRTVLKLISGANFRRVYVIPCENIIAKLPRVSTFSRHLATSYITRPVVSGTSSRSISWFCYRSGLRYNQDEGDMIRWYTPAKLHGVIIQTPHSKLQSSGKAQMSRSACELFWSEGLTV
jgi:hypothetical protein